MKERKLSIAQNTVYNTAGSCFYLVCQWLLTVLAVRLGSVESGGILAVAMSVTNVLFTLSTFGIRTFQVSDVRRKYSVDTYVTTRLLTCGFGLLLCGIYCLADGSRSREEAACILVYMLFRVSEALSDENQAVQQTEGRMDTVFWSFVLRGILLIASFSLVLKTTGRLLWAFAAMAAATNAVVLFFEFPVSRKLSGFRLRWNLPASLRLLGENVPLMLNSLLMAFLVTIPRTRLDALMGNYVMGIYGSIAAPAAVVQSAALWLFTPSLTAFAEHWDRGDRAAFYRLHHRMLLLLLGAAAVCLVGAKLLGRWGLGLLFGPEIAAEEALLVPTLLTTVLIAGEYYLSALLTVCRKLRSIVVSNLAAMAVTLLSPTY